MTLLEAIDHRTSIRNYANRPIDKQSIHALFQSIDKYNAQADLNITLIMDGAVAFKRFFKSYGMFTGVRSIIVLKGKRDTPCIFEKLGYYGEQLVIQAVALGLDTCWVGGSFDKRCPIFQLHPEEALAAVLTIGYNSGNMTFMNKLVRGATQEKKPVSARFQAVGDPPQWFYAGMDAVQKAPSAMNRQSVSFHYNAGVVTAGINGKKYLELMDYLDLGIAKAHFDLAAGGQFAFGNNGTFKKKEN